MKVVIAGSLNMDFVVQMAALPLPGETVTGRDFVTLPGGKGANQACAVGRLSRGGAGAMIGCVGADVHGAQLIESLRGAGIDTRFVREVPDVATGVALIFVEQGGQNQIVIAPGANERLGASEVEAALDSLGGSHLLLQLESPLDTVEAAARRGKALGMTVILDPAPVRPLPPSLLACVDVLTPNETEARALAGLAGGDIDLADAPAIAQRLLALGPRQVILKLGAKGAWFADATGGQHFAAHAVQAVDATAAGDCFNGALAAGLAEGMPMAKAIELACAAAALSVTRLGAQASIPYREDLI